MLDDKDIDTCPYFMIHPLYKHIYLLIMKHNFVKFGYLKLKPGIGEENIGRCDLKLKSS